MNRTIGLQLAVYALLLGGLSLLTHRLAPDLAGPTLIAGLPGGALCLVWGVRSALGYGGKTLPILTLVPVSFVMLSQSVLGWSGGTEVGRRPAAAVITVLLVLSFAMLMRIAYAGVAFDGPPVSRLKHADGKGPAGGSTASQANPRQRA